MPDETLRIKRYPNRRFYARHVKKYVSLEDIERWIHEGHRVAIEDSQTGDDLTRSILTQLLIERHPEKVALFPAELLHCMLRADDLTSDFLRNYFDASLTYLDYLKSPATAAPMAQPLRWMRAWFDQSVPGFSATAPRDPVEDHTRSPQAKAEDEELRAADEESRAADGGQRADQNAEPDTSDDRERARQMAEHIRELEERIRRLELQGDDKSS